MSEDIFVFNSPSLIVDIKPKNSATEWSLDLDYERLPYPLYIKASTYKINPVLFPNVPSSLVDVEGEAGSLVNMSKRGSLISPDKQWMFTKPAFRKGHVIGCEYGVIALGSAMFDDTVEIPMLWQKTHGQWRLWMSYTPSELLTLRPGTLLARGHTVVVGLGMGHQLYEVCSRPEVTKVTLVEYSKSLADWIWPELKPQLRGIWESNHSTSLNISIVIGDAFTVMSRFNADIALVDIFGDFGGNEKHMNVMKRRCPGIKSWWAWGA